MLVEQPPQLQASFYTIKSALGLKKDLKVQVEEAEDEED